MGNLRKKLPSLTALTAFESAARNASFTRAADELGIGQAAISRQIHLLENDLGFALFERLHRRIELTQKGRALFAAASDAFHLLADTADQLRREGTQDELAISATISFAQFWLLPRIARFSRAYPDIKLRIITQDGKTTLEGGDIDLAIRYGMGSWPDGTARILFEDEIFPICSPDYLQQAERIRTPDDLANHRLIASDSYDPMWTGWDEWLSSLSVKAPNAVSSLRCSHYTEAIYAAMNGQGIALGWSRLVDEFVKQGRLVRVTTASLKTRAAYFVVLAKRKTEKETVRLFMQWIKQEAEAHFT